MNADPNFRARKRTPYIIAGSALVGLVGLGFVGCAHSMIAFVDHIGTNKTASAAVLAPEPALTISPVAEVTDAPFPQVSPRMAQIIRHAMVPTLHTAAPQRQCCVTTQVAFRAQPSPQPVPSPMVQRRQLTEMKFDSRDDAQNAQAQQDLRVAQVAATTTQGLGYETPAPVSARYIQPSQYQIGEEQFISVQLTTDVLSEHPGEVRGVVLSPVLSSTDHATVLIPQGAMMIGDDSHASVQQGQGRLAIDWREIVFPNAVRYPIGSQQSADQMGAAGVPGQVDSHQGRVFGSFVLYTLVNGIANAFSRVSYLGGSNISTQFAGQAQDIRPTISVPANTKITIYLSEPLPMRPWTEVQAMVK